MKHAGQVNANGRVERIRFPFVTLQAAGIIDQDIQFGE